MKQVSRYVSKDGCEFTSRKACETYERECEEIDAIMARLKKRPNDDGCNFSNGRGFLRHDKDRFLSVQRALVEISERKFKNDATIKKHFAFAAGADRPVGRTFLGRLIDDAGSAALRRAWSRIQCVSDDFREFGQPYYALHPHEAEQVDLS